jgi:hypothetical protein
MWCHMLVVSCHPELKDVWWWPPAGFQDGDSVREALAAMLTTQLTLREVRVEATKAA